LPSTNDWWPRTILKCAKGMLTKIITSFKFAPKTHFRDGFEVGGQMIPDAGSGNGEGAFTKFESWLTA